MLVALSLIISGMMMLSGCSKDDSSTTETASTAFTGTMYMAGGSGGHIGVFPVTIDPSNTTEPIVVGTATKIQVLGGTSDAATRLMFHDVRFGVKSDGTEDYDRIYYSGMMSLSTNTAVVPIGYVDLTGTLTGNNVGKNSTIDIDNTATGPFTNGMDTIAFALGLIAPLEFSTTTRINYCGSGMNATHFFPMSMAFPAYIDAIPNAKLDTAGAHLVKDTDFKRTYIGQIDDSMNLSLWTGITATIPIDNPFNGGNLPLSILGYPPLAFIHGASSPDGTKIFMSTNQMQGLLTTSNTAGVIRAYIVNASDLVSGGMTTSKVVAKASYNVASSVSTTNAFTNKHGELQGTIAYRASYTPDGNYILQSGSDRMLILNAADLSLYVDTANGSTTPSGVSALAAAEISSGLGAGTFGGIEVHDAIGTKNSDYAVVAVRYYAGSDEAAAGIKSSGVQLYDIKNKAFIGKVSTTCGKCHNGVLGVGDDTTRPTCGLISKWN